MSRAATRKAVSGICISAMLLSAAAWVPPAHAGGGDPNLELASVRSEIRQLAGDGRCSESSQCRAIPIGKRDCGGPDEYVVFSTVTAKAAALEARAAAYTALQEEILRDRAGVGSCEIILEPKVACVQQRCQTVEE